MIPIVLQRGFYLVYSPLAPIAVLDLFPDLRVQLLDVLNSLSADEWALPTACAGWSVKDVALHLLGDDLGLLSRRRDGHSVSVDINSLDELIVFINDLNETWVATLRRLSPRVICDLLAFSGPMLHAFFATWDVNALGGSVGWTGNDADPVWLDLAREYTEFWMHQMHIRDAVGQPNPLQEPRFFRPLLATFMYGVPRAYTDTEAADGTLVEIVITGAAGGTWHLVRDGGRWALYADTGLTPTSVVTLDGSTAWKLFTKGMTPAEAAPQVTISGDQALGCVLLNTVSILA